MSENVKSITSPTLPEKLNPSEKALIEFYERTEEECGGRARIIETLVRTGDRRAVRLIQELGKATNGHKPLYKILKKLGISNSDFMDLISTGDVVQAIFKAQRKFADSLEDVAEATVLSAKIKGDKGYKDREMIFKLTGLLRKDQPMVAINLNQTFSGVGSFEKVVGGASKLAQTDPFEDVEVIDD